MRGLTGTLPWWDYLGGMLITALIFGAVMLAVGATLGVVTGLWCWCAGPTLRAP